jgi:phosphoribosylaminoimidazole-succinocarboxamide synthase
MVENQAFKSPILTPATKAKEGHDEDISESEILSRGLVSSEIWEEVRTLAFQLFERGSKIAAEKDLILVDTKYEFGLQNGRVILIDEVHTPDSSRYFYAGPYHENLAKGLPQKQLSKEFIREWLIANNFQGIEGQVLPDLTDDFRIEIYERYVELFNKLTGTQFTPVPTSNFDQEIESILNKYL